MKLTPQIFSEFTKKLTEEHTQTAEKALAFLVKEGIYNQDGTLAPEFGGAPKESSKE